MGEQENKHPHDEFGPDDAPEDADQPDPEFTGAAESPDEPADDGKSVAALTDEIASLREALLRTRAESENMQKRAERELEKFRRFSQERIMQDLLPVIDSLEQGLASGGDADRVAEGMVLTRKLFLQALEKHGLEMLDPQGEVFDPNWHEAMATQPTGDAAPETVIQVLQKGFRLHDRLLRPARVIVAKGLED